MTNTALDTYMPLLEQALGTDEVTDVRGEVLRIMGPDDHPIIVTYRLSDHDILYTIRDDGRYVQTCRDVGRAQVVAHALSMVFPRQRKHIAFHAHRICDMNHISGEQPNGRAHDLALLAHQRLTRCAR